MRDREGTSDEEGPARRAGRTTDRDSPQGVGGGRARRDPRPGVLPRGDLGPADRADAALHEPGGRDRLPRVRLGGSVPRAPAPQRVLRERRQAHQRRGDVAARHGRLLPPAHRLRAGPALRPVAQPAGQADRADGQAARLGPLRADQLARRPGAAGRRAEGAGLAGRGGLLHVGPGQQRGRLPPAALRPGLRHQQPARLQQHVPRVQRVRPPRDPGHRQGHGEPGGHPPRRPDPRGGPEPRNQPPASARRWRRPRATAPASSR